MSVAAGRPVSADVLAHLQSAARIWERGDKALANLRLVFGKLPRLDDPVDAARVSLAAYCLDQGMAPRALMDELGLDTRALDLVKYDPSQPRVPAGSGEESGRWASAAIGLAFDAPPPSLLADVGPELLSGFIRFAARFSTPTAVLGALICPTPNSGGVTTGNLPGAPDISFRKDDPAGTLRLTTKAPDGSDVIVVAQNQRGLYVNVETGSALGRNLDGQLYLVARVHVVVDEIAGIAKAILEMDVLAGHGVEQLDVKSDVSGRGPRLFELNTSAGSNWKNVVNLRTDFRFVPDRAIVEYHLFRPALLTIAENFDAERAYAYPIKLQDFWPRPPNLNPPFPIAWISYCAPRIAHLVTPPSTAIVRTAACSWQRRTKHSTSTIRNTWPSRATSRRLWLR